MGYVDAMYMTTVSMATVGFVHARSVLWKQLNSSSVAHLTPALTTLPESCAAVDFAVLRSSDYLPTTTVGEIIGLFWLPASTVLAGYALTMPISVHLSEKEAALKDKILSEELEFEELLKADDDGDGDVSQSEYILTASIDAAAHVKA
eukprot:11273-Heterococcus_DN1.PRE.1